LENRESIDNKMSRRIWEKMENRKTDKARMAKVERERGKEKRV